MTTYLGSIHGSSLLSKTVPGLLETLDRLFVPAKLLLHLTQNPMRCLFVMIATTLALALAIGAPVAAFANSSAMDTVNAECPVSGMPVKAGMEVETKDGNIGVCCGKCEAAVEAWSAEKKAQFVANHTAQADAKKADAKAAPAWDGEPYLLTTCAASGRSIDVKDTPTTKVVDGRELKFCCGGCAAAVAKDPARFLPKVDKVQIKAQAAIYPVETCCVSGEPLMEKNAEGKMEYTGTDIIVKNRLFRVCCKMCAKKVLDKPGAYALKLNEAVAKTQGSAYALDACCVNPKGSVAGDKAKSFVIGGRLVKTCCGRCEAKVRAEPTKYVAMVDAAIAEKREAAKKNAPKAKKAAK